MSETLGGRAFAGDWPLACPACGPRPGLMAQHDGAVCPVCGRHYPYHDGVWDLLPADRVVAWADFLREYAAVRAEEGRHLDPAALRLLPETASDDPRAWEWSVRRATFHTLVRDALPGRSLKVLDIGAGNGWLSHRLWQLGHRSAAVDLRLDAGDGLLGARAFDLGRDEPAFPRLRAEFDRLPVAARSADAVVFNAALHYSADYRVTLSEALRVMTASGRLVVADSPIYSGEEEGEAMVSERKEAFRRRYGFASDHHGGREYLTWGQIEALGSELGLRWQVLHPRYGWRYRLRPVAAQLRGRRRPSTFAVLVATRATR